MNKSTTPNADFGGEIERLRKLGWVLRWDAPCSLPDEIQLRYPWLPDDYIQFTRSLVTCVSIDETRWILSPEEFDRNADHAFAHDEWEKLALEAAHGDEDLTRAIRAFWDAHFPIFFDVGDGYAFHALKVDDRSGTVVSGRGPEFEEVAVVALSFSDFLARLQ